MGFGISCMGLLLGGCDAEYEHKHFKLHLFSVEQVGQVFFIHTHTQTFIFIYIYIFVAFSFHLLLQLRSTGYHPDRYHTIQCIVPLYHFEVSIRHRWKIFSSARLNLVFESRIYIICVERERETKRRIRWWWTNWWCWKLKQY